MPAPFTVLLMAYGCPDTPEDVEPFARQVWGAALTPADLAAARRRYQRIAGRPSLRDLIDVQASALARELGATVYSGMRYGRPSIAEVVERIAGAGDARVVGLVMAPHYSAFTVGDYEKQLIAAAKGRLELGLVRSWGEHPGFVKAAEHQLRQALQRFDAPRKVPVVFAGPSIPRRLVEAGDAYPEQLHDSAAAVAQRVRLAVWHVGYHLPWTITEPWIGPEPPEVFARLAGEGYRDVLIAPLGFVCDQVETFYDMDVEFQERAAALGLRLERAAALNEDPDLIRCLAALARDEARERGWAEDSGERRL